MECPGSHLSVCCACPAISCFIPSARSSRKLCFSRPTNLRPARECIGVTILYLPHPPSSVSTLALSSLRATRILSSSASISPITFLSCPASHWPPTNPV